MGGEGLRLPAEGDTSGEERGECAEDPLGAIGWKAEPDGELGDEAALVLGDVDGAGYGENLCWPRSLSAAAALAAIELRLAAYAA